MAWIAPRPLYILLGVRGFQREKEIWRRKEKHVSSNYQMGEKSIFFQVNFFDFLLYIYIFFINKTTSCCTSKKSCPFHIATNYMKLDKTSWACSIHFSFSPDGIFNDVKDCSPAFCIFSRLPACTKKHFFLYI
mgnify:CR=1 FL=1